MQILGTNGQYAVAVSEGNLGFYGTNPLGQVSALLLNLGKDSPSLRKEASITLYCEENLQSGCLLVSLEKDNLLVERLVATSFTLVFSTTRGDIRIYRDNAGKVAAFVDGFSYLYLCATQELEESLVTTLQVWSGAKPES